MIKLNKEGCNRAHELVDVSVMLSIATIDDPIDFLRNGDAKTATLDIETMDSKALKLWNEPVISYAVSFLSGSLDRLHCPTFSSIAENLGEETSLLSQVIGILRICKERGITLCGHNINCLHEHVPTVARWSEGYDLPKIIKRADCYRLDGGFISTLKTFDTMDLAVVSYDHSQHNHSLSSGEKQRVLGLPCLESDLNIIRPDGQEKLGSRIREIYTNYLRTREQAKLREIMLYNCVDCISESLVSKIFVLCVNECGLCNRLVPPRNRCNRIPSEFRIGEMIEWKQLSGSKLTRD
jgi:hypothetical protein